METTNQPAKREPTTAQLDAEIARNKLLLDSPIVPTARIEKRLRKLYARRYDYAKGSVAERLEAVERQIEFERLLVKLLDLETDYRPAMSVMLGRDVKPARSAVKRYNELKANITALRAARRALLDKR